MDSFTKICVLILVVLYGLCIGSYLNVVIYRLPLGKKTSKGRSFCPKCGNMIRWYDNIPLFSYLFLGGKCRKCKLPISPRYPVIEALNAVLWLASFILFYDTPVYAGCCCICFSVLICVFMIDFEHKIIFDRFHVIILCLGIVVFSVDVRVVWYSHLIGMAAGLVSFFLIRFFVSKAVGVEAMGLGDVKLATCMGLFLGWEKFLLAMLISSVSACIVLTVVSKLKKYEKNHEFPFGPFLCVGFGVAILFGSFIIEAYLNMLG